jgi:hypothetical protein
MGQKPFVLDARRLALFPMSKDWFPRLENPDRGPVSVHWVKTFQKEVSRVAYAFASRASHIELLGTSALKLH